MSTRANIYIYIYTSVSRWASRSNQCRECIKRERWAIAEFPHQRASWQGRLFIKGPRPFPSIWSGAAGLKRERRWERRRTDLRSPVSRRPSPGFQIMISPYFGQLTRVERDSIVSNFLTGAGVRPDPINYARTRENNWFRLWWWIQAAILALDWFRTLFAEVGNQQSGLRVRRTCFRNSAPEAVCNTINAIVIGNT